MADSLGTSAGGRTAHIYRKKEKRRKMTTMQNSLEAKRLSVMQKQIRSSESKELFEMDRKLNRVFKSNDEIKAFQKALIQRLSHVNQSSQLSGGNRPLYNLGRYGGASIEQIRIESEKYKPIRDPRVVRMMRAKQLLAQGNLDGRIINLKPKLVGDLTEKILQLDKISPRVAPKPLFPSDVANLNDVMEDQEEEMGITKPKTREFSTLVVRRRRLKLPPVTKQNHVIHNHARHSPVENVVVRKTFPLQGIVTQPANGEEEHRPTSKSRDYQGSERKYFEWDYTKPLGPISKGNRKHIEEPQKFWKQTDSIVIKPMHQRIVLPRIR